MDRGGSDLGRQFDERLRLIELYEQAGFHAYHLAEHHATPLGMAPSPSVFLAAVAQRTKTLRFGPLVYTVNLYHPLRLIDEICMLDQLSGGRLELGIGRGISPYEVGYYGVDPATGPERFAEALDVILKGLTEKRLSHHGKYFTFEDVPMEMQPVQRPHPPLWYGVHSTDSAERAARLGSNIACNEPADASAAYIERYWSVWREAQGDRAYRADGFSAATRKATSPENAMEPKAGVTQFVVVADSDDAALSIARRAYLVWHKSFHHLFRRHGRVAKISGGEADFDELSARGKGVAGTPDTVLRFLTARLGKTGANYCINRFAFGDLSLAESLRSVELFARDVQPALQHT
jgi:alkanesulfonate monooxygenase SsuD/methylene tetrahydromethanopterin reductase-like flavin-dependent oxidoreductase (luciferase family)